MYDTVDYAASRLNGTIVRHDGDPVTILEIGGRRNNLTCSYTTVATEEQGQDHLNAFDLTPVPLGFAWCPDGLAYLTRIPRRGDYRQGLRNNNYTSLTGVDHRAVLPQQLVKTIKGQFRSFESALDECVNIRGSHLAFNRNFALISNGNSQIGLHYRWFGKIGDVVNGLITLDDKYQHVQEFLEESMA